MAIVIAGSGSGAGGREESDCSVAIWALKYQRNIHFVCGLSLSGVAPWNKRSKLLSV